MADTSSAARISAEVPRAPNMQMTYSGVSSPAVLSAAQRASLAATRDCACTPAEAAMTCKAAAKAKFPGDMKSRHAWKKECKAHWKASQKA